MIVELIKEGYVMATEIMAFVNLKSVTSTKREKMVF